MSNLAAQVSLYPLAEQDVSPRIDGIIDVFRTHQISVEPGPMSTLLVGDEAEIFAALHEAARVASAEGKMVMVVTISNACAIPD